MNTNFREELKAAILAEFPQAANPEVTLDEYLDEAEEAHKVHPSIDISTFVVDFATPRGYYNELNPNLDYSKPLNESFITLGSKSSLPKSNPVGRGGGKEEVVVKKEPMSDEEYAKRRLKAIDTIKPKQTYMTATVKRKRCKTFTDDFMGTQRIKKYVASMLPKGSYCYHVTLRNDHGIEVFIMLPNHNILTEIVGAKVDNVIRIPTDTPRRLHALSKYKVLTPYKVVYDVVDSAVQRNRIMEEIHNPQTPFNEWE